MKLSAEEQARAEDFFKVQTAESRVKTSIVEHFFVGWARIIGNFQKKQGRAVSLAYADLFAGRGVYEDGGEGTAVRVARQVVGNDTWRESTLMFFNEPDPKLHEVLKRSVLAVPRASELKHAPIFRNEVVAADYRSCLSELGGRPTLFFVDPFGYKEIALGLLHDLVADGFGNDLVFFFNYRRVNAATSNSRFTKHMEEMFGADRAAALAAQVRPLRGFKREQVIVEAIASEVSSHVGKYVQRFRFAPRGKEATHYLFFVSKHPKGHELMTSIMGKRSSSNVGGVPTFEFSDTSTPLLFVVDEVERHADKIAEAFAGSEMTVDGIYSKYSVGRQVLRKTVKDALRRLESRDLIEVIPSADLRREGTLSDKAVVTFPAEGSNELDE